MPKQEKKEKDKNKVGFAGQQEEMGSRVNPAWGEKVMFLKFFLAVCYRWG